MKKEEIKEDRTKVEGRGGGKRRREKRGVDGGRREKGEEMMG